MNGKIVADGNRRAALADWVVARDNPLFARNLVNRVWEQLYGKTLVPNFDKPATKADSLAVLALLSEDFAANGHDLRRLLRIIVLSKTYSQASSPRARPTWARPAARPMSVDQLHASIAQATGYDGPPLTPPKRRATATKMTPTRTRVPPSPSGRRDTPTDHEADGEADDDEQRRRPSSRGAWRAGLDLATRLGAPERRIRQGGVPIGGAGFSSPPGRTGDDSRIEWACLATLTRRPTAKSKRCSAPCWPSRTGSKTSTGS